ncbi:hypothetical protein WA1_51515 [Scytonema hofmannii PCC 7110]|uniref:Uncharacterized protein n=1 Tax=Scytonema hofmannii PCC 7110 TaxID=128403 RepID=A0A139WQC2_9CYAN|nr:hypothetical protein [Scytonema hofmannii]KYC34627.1 hypothetical protein WA1_51515 [Scytonema hofmannii PCC 7110]
MSQPTTGFDDTLVRTILILAANPTGTSHLRFTGHGESDNGLHLFQTPKGKVVLPQPLDAPCHVIVKKEETSASQC